MGVSTLPVQYGSHNKRCHGTPARSTRQARYKYHRSGANLAEKALESAGECSTSVLVHPQSAHLTYWVGPRCPRCCIVQKTLCCVPPRRLNASSIRRAHSCCVVRLRALMSRCGKPTTQSRKVTLRAPQRRYPGGRWHLTGSPDAHRMHKLRISMPGKIRVIHL